MRDGTRAIWKTAASNVATVAAVLMGSFVADVARAQPAVQLVAPTEALTPEDEQARFHLPEGFEIELVASEPEIQKPMNLAFDARGRLWVTMSVEYPYAAAEDAPKRDLLKILEDKDGDGRAETATTFADGLNIPIGVLPLAKGAMAWSIPNIYRLHDEDGDDRSEKREAYYGEFGFRDTHGMCNSFTRWIDGWIYGCHGFANTSEVAGADGQAITMNSGNTYRMRDDGSHIEYFTHGQVNPFGMGFDPLGNVYTADCHTKPLYMLLRGAWYPSFGKPHDGMGFGPEMIDHLHGSTGIAGVVYYAAKQFPTAYQGTVFIGNPVTGRVNRDRLAVYGSTYEAVEEPDFLWCDDPWFRPVSIVLGPDGALYIADFYNAIIGHYEVPLEHPKRDRRRGRIWRVVYRGEGAGSDRGPGDLTKRSGRELATMLEHSNLAVRVAATHAIVDASDERAIAAAMGMLESGTPNGRVHAMWVVERTGGLDEGRLMKLLADDAREVRVHAVKLLAERNDWKRGGGDWASQVREMLKDQDAFVRRAAADALGRHPAAENVRPLLELWRTTDAEDTHLIHVARMAVRDHLLVPGMYETAEAMLAEISSSPKDGYGEQLADVSLGVREAPAAAYLLGYLRSGGRDTARAGEYLYHAARYADDAVREAVYATLKQYAGGELARQRTVLSAVARAEAERGREFDGPFPGEIDSWAQAVAEVSLASDKISDVREGIQFARDLKMRRAGRWLRDVAAPGARIEGLRRNALEALAEVDPRMAVPLLAHVVASADERSNLRRAAARSLAVAHAEAGATEALTAALATAPSPVAVEIATGLASWRKGAETLLKEVDAGRASAALLARNEVKDRLLRSGLPGAADEIARRLEGLPDEDQRLAALVDARRDGFGKTDGSAERGREVFKKACAACHRLDGMGEKVGPELEGIGLRGLERILEDVLVPSRNVDATFRATVIETEDGRVLTGLVTEDEGATVVIVDAEGKPTRIAAEEIVARGRSALSPMPANVAEVVSEAEFYDLVAYLLGQREK